MKTHQMSLSVENQAETALYRDLTEQEQEMLGGGYATNIAWKYLNLATMYNWHFGGGKQKFVNNVKQNGLGVIDKRVNAILGNLRRFW
jgi:hypothetical protein